MISEKVLSVLDALDRYPWHRDAACAGSDDPEMWFYEEGSQERGNLSNPRALEAWLTCAGCLVRKDCLTEALTPIVVHFPGLPPTTVRATGTWGATSIQDRTEVRSLPIGEAIDRLEAGLPNRVRTRIEAFEAHYPRDGRRNQNAERTRALLEEMRAGHATDEVHEINATP